MIKASAITWYLKAYVICYAGRKATNESPAQSGYGTCRRENTRLKLVPPRDMLVHSHSKMMTHSDTKRSEQMHTIICA